jgi:hypothetical protein
VILSPATFCPTRQPRDTLLASARGLLWDRIGAATVRERLCLSPLCAVR